MTRIDKYVWSVRLTKTRSLATKLCKAGKIQLNDQEVKPAIEVKTGDTISVKKNNAVFSYKVKDLLDKRVGAKLVDQYIRNITSQEEIEKFEAYRQAQQEYRKSGLGKPTKKERRNLRKFLK